MLSYLAGLDVGPTLKELGPLHPWDQCLDFRYSADHLKVLSDLILVPYSQIILKICPPCSLDYKVFMEPNKQCMNVFKYLHIWNNFHSLTGKRDCLGRSLALSQFFLFFASLMQRYSFKSIHKNLDMVDTAPVVMFTQTPKPFKVIINRKS